MWRCCIWGNPAKVGVFRVTGGELFEDIVAREFYSEADARYGSLLAVMACLWRADMLLPRY